MRLKIDWLGMLGTSALIGLLAAASDAAAQTPGCEEPMAECAGSISGDCLSAGRLGAGAIAAQALGCEGQFEEYRACLAGFVERCGQTTTASGASACDAETARVLWEDVKQADDCLAYEGYREACPETPQARIAATRLARLGCANAVTQRGDAEPDAPLRQIGAPGRAHGGAVTAVAVIDGRRALTASADRSLKLWDLERGAEIRTLAMHQGGVADAAVSPDGRMALSGGEDGALILWALESGAPSLLGRLDGPVRSVVFIDGGQRALTISPVEGEGLKLWSVLENRQAGGGDKVFAMTARLAVSPDGSLVVGASYDDDRALRVYSANRNSVLRNEDPGAATITAVAFSPDNRSVLVGRRDGSVSVDGAIAKGGGASPATSAAYDPLGGRAVTGAEDGSVTLWDVGQRQAVEAKKPGAAAVTSVAFTRDGQSVLVGAADGTVTLWRPEAR